MTKLSDTQTIILAEASQRPDGNLLPLPGSLRGGAQGKVIGALLSRGLIAEKVTESRQQPDAALNTVWRNGEDGRAVLLFITPAGLEAIGVEPGGTEGAEPPEAAPESQSATERAREAGSAAVTNDGGQDLGPRSASKNSAKTVAVRPLIASTRSWRPSSGPAVTSTVSPISNSAPVVIQR